MKETALRTLTALLVLSVIVLFTNGDYALAQQTVTEQADTTSTDATTGANYLPYLFAAYAVTWAGFFVYLHYLSQRQRSLRQEIAELREALAERDRRDRG